VSAISKNSDVRNEFYKRVKKLGITLERAPRTPDDHLLSIIHPDQFSWDTEKGEYEQHTTAIEWLATHLHSWENIKGKVDIRRPKNPANILSLEDSPIRTKGGTDAVACHVRYLDMQDEAGIVQHLGVVIEFKMNYKEEDLHQAYAEHILADLKHSHYEPFPIVTLVTDLKTAFHFIWTAKDNFVLVQKVQSSRVACEWLNYILCDYAGVAAVLRRVPAALAFPLKSKERHRLTIAESEPAEDVADFDDFDDDPVVSQVNRILRYSTGLPKEVRGHLMSLVLDVAVDS